MAEGAMFSVASDVLSTITSSAFKKAYEKGRSIWKARDELEKLKRSIETIRAVLLDAEKKQDYAVKVWIKRVRDVLYDAEDLFDEVATDDKLKQLFKELEGNSKLYLINEVRFCCFNVNSIVSRNSIANQVQDITQRILEISRDMRQFEFVKCVDEKVPTDLRRGQDPGCYVDPKEVIGRDEDKKALLEMLFDESDNAKPDFPIVISVVGIARMGKTTLAQLVYNDEEVRIHFQYRWFACISDTTDEKEIIGKVFQSIFREDYSSLDVGQLQTKIRESIKEDKKFLLVIDDVWDGDRARWKNRMSLLGGAAKGSKIVVTTRIPEVARAVGSFKTHRLHGLSEDESWSLFKSVAFTPEQENDSKWTDLGREIVKRCRDVPLAIRCIGSLLFKKNTIQEWAAIRDEIIPGQSHADGIMRELKLSYDHLRSDLKQCFAYCSLFPKDYRFDKWMLIYLWIAQGYIRQNNEDMGLSNFLDLLRGGFFQEVVKDQFGEIESCKMHDLIHDLALHVVGEEGAMLASTSSDTSNCIRHRSIMEYKNRESCVIPTQLLNAKGLRSCMLMGRGSICSAATVNQLFDNFRKLRALSLSGLGIKNVSCAIKELKHLRYLDLSMNEFETLPDTVINLVNLVILNISQCEEIKALPEDLRKLINLRCLNIRGCNKLKHMPSGIGEMSCLRYLSDLKVGKAPTVLEERVVKRSGLAELARLEHQLRGELSIEFEGGIDEEEVRDGDECIWKLPVSLQQLSIFKYPGRRIPNWCTNGRANNLASLKLEGCEKVKYLPPLSCLPNLRDLTLHGLVELEYVEEEDDESIRNNVSISRFFPCLEKLELKNLLELKGWKKVGMTDSSSAVCASVPHQKQFPLLSHLSINNCCKLDLNSLPLCPHLHVLHLDGMHNNEVIPQLPLYYSYPYPYIPAYPYTPSYTIQPMYAFHSSLASTSPYLQSNITISFCKWKQISIKALTSFQLSVANGSCGSFQSLHLTSPHLQKICIENCDELMSFELLIEAPTTSLRVLEIENCKQLKNLHIAGHLNDLERLVINNCPELKLWESPDNSHWCDLDWDSFTNLRDLQLDPLPPPEKLPCCLRQRNDIGKLNITDHQNVHYEENPNACVIQ